MNRKQASHDRKRSAKSKSIGWFQAMACRRQGRADGRCAIQLSLDTDCISPYVQEMVTLCHKRTLEEIQRLRRYRDEQFIEEANLYASLQRNDEQQGDCWDHLQLIGSRFDLERVEAGEDHLKSQIRRKRRQRELEDLESKDREKLHQLVLEGAALRQRRDELKAANREAELKTRQDVQCWRGWRGMLGVECWRGMLTIYLDIKNEP